MTARDIFEVLRDVAGLPDTMLWAEVGVKVPQARVIVERVDMIADRLDAVTKKRDDARADAADLARDLRVADEERELLAAARDRLAGDVRRLEAQIEAVRDLHTESPAWFCPSCARLGDVSDVDDGLVAHPCPTLRALSNPITEEQPDDRSADR